MITALIKVASLSIVFVLIRKFGEKWTVCLGIFFIILHFVCFAKLESLNIPLPILAATLGIANAFLYPSFRVSFSLAPETKK